jgi:NAD(P)-dependent dehydrogenase (short-subunit alcohol dehydrogenase family)
MHETAKNALVTGGTDGIGKEIAFELARRGTSVLIVGRDPEKGKAAARKLQERAANSNVEFFPSDLTSMKEAAGLARFVVARWHQLHYLVHSAGFVRGAHVFTTDGVESNFAVNYLSRFRLTLGLLSHLHAGGRSSGAARVVLVGGGATIGKVHFEDINLTRHWFRSAKAILQFQCANDIFTIELARRLNSIPADVGEVRVNILKYGIVRTNIRREMPLWLRALSSVGYRFVGQTASQAAASASKVLFDPEFEQANGAMFLCSPKFQQITPRPLVASPEQGARLWALSEKLCGIGSGQAVESSLRSARDNSSAITVP